MLIDVCMLACSRTKALYDMTQRAINSLHDSEKRHKFNVYVFESAEQIAAEPVKIEGEYRIKTDEARQFVLFGNRYVTPAKVPPSSMIRCLMVNGRWEIDYMGETVLYCYPKIDKPEKIEDFTGATTVRLPKPFNYNKCINYVIERMTGDYLLVSNNDVHYHPGWFKEMLKVKGWDSASGFDSICPPDKDMKDVIREGYDMATCVRAHSIICTKEAIEKIGKYDEQFDFYYQDNDYIECLKKHGLKHFHIGTAKIDHIHHGTTSLNGSKWEMEKFAEGRKKFEAKWGPL